MAELTITRNEFRAYEAVRVGGLTNMWDTQTVEMLSGLDRDTILEIMKHYGELNRRYPGARKDPMPTRPTETGN